MKLQYLLLAAAISMPMVQALAADAAPAEQAIRALLEQSREKQRGVTLHVNGASVSLVVTEIADGVVVGKNQQSSRIVVRMERIDAAAAMF